MTSHAGNRNGGMLISRNEISMPKWVTEQNDRIGPKPPPPPGTPENVPPPTKQLSLAPKTKQPEPDYEVIEFSNQQYSNTPLRPNSASSGSKTPDNKLKCTLCGSGNPWVTCDACSQQLFCASCDDMFHKHPKRKGHQRKTIDKSLPPLPPKVLPGQPGPSPPVAPPRRNKRGFMTPLMQRKDQGNAVPGPFPEPISPSPTSKSSSLQDRIGSLPRGLNLFNRPLPDTPKTPSESSRSTTPKSVFDNIQRPPSVALEKIKTKANATLDRMQILQQRYRQQKEQMERERSGSVTDQNLSAFDQWSSISQSPSHFRSGSMSSGINSSHLDLVDDNDFNLFHQHQMALQHHQVASQRANQMGQRGMSSSVFNLNQMNRKQPVASNGWINNSMQQAQSMAHINCGNCGQHQLQWNGHNQPHMQKVHDPWSSQLASQQHLNRSNMSLNVSAGYMMQPQMNNMYPPPAFMNQRNFMHPMYPQPYMGGMPVMNPGLMCMPPSRAASRAGSRMASPAMSRKSVTLRRKQRSSYIDDEATDDEDSDEYDRRSITSIRSGITRPRQRRMSSASQFQLDDDIESTQAKPHRNRLRNQRRDSVANSVHNDWTPGRKASSSNNNRSADSGFNSPLKPSRIYSDLDSEGSGTRALVQAKIEQKLKEESLKQKQSRSKKQSKSPPPQKTSSAVQTPAVKQAKKEDKIEKAQQETQTHVKQSSENEIEKEKERPKLVENLEKDSKRTEKEEEEGSKNLSPSESESEIESELSEESDTKQEIEENENLENNEIQEDDLGPPPSTPDHEWECEFCTFVNEANIKICTICCKTPSVQPKKAIKTITPPQQQLKSPMQQNEKEPAKRVEKKAESQKSGTIKKSPFTSSKPTASETSQPADNTTNHIDSSKDTPKTKESVEDVWASLDENIQTTAHEVTLKAQNKKSAKQSSYSQENDLRQSQAREIGTSPPPQTISTQTYDTLPLQKQQARGESIAKQASQPSFDDVIQHTNFSLNSKIQDLRSFEAEVLNNIHNISHVPPHSNHHHVNSAPHFYNQRQRYRSSSDLRLDDTVSVDFEGFNGLGKREPSINELIMLQKTSSQMHSPYGGSTYDLPYRELSTIKPKDMENHKESDLYKHTTEELNAAIKYCGPDIHPLVWLRDNWPKLIQTVQSLATKYGQERAENTIGTISQMEAREALRMHTGNIWQAVSECIEQRQRKYREISSKGNFSREDIVTALTSHQGNVDLALIDLGQTQLKPFLMRIWGSPGGVENESGPLSFATNSTTHLGMDKDIHKFLKANASECMQTPNATGANPIHNQTPSPHNHIFDNASSVSTDSKITANSPLQVDESILSNKNVLKDLETLIGNMENSQQKQNENVLRSIHDMVANLTNKSESEYDPDATRILAKSPIISSKLKTSSKGINPENKSDIKNFVWQHIQDIMPNLVQQVEQELVEGNENESKSNGVAKENEIQTEVKPPPPPPPPIDQDEFLMEEVIKPNIKNASIREELPPQYVYTAEIATFKLTFDKALGTEHEEEFEFEILEEASRQIYRMFLAPKVENSQEKTNQIEQEQAAQFNSSIVDLQASENGISLVSENELNLPNEKILKTDMDKTEDPLIVQDEFQLENEPAISQSETSLKNRSDLEQYEQESLEMANTATAESFDANSKPIKENKLEMTNLTNITHQIVDPTVSTHSTENKVNTAMQPTLPETVHTAETNSRNAKAEGQTQADKEQTQEVEQQYESSIFSTADPKNLSSSLIANNSQDENFTQESSLLINGNIDSKDVNTFNDISSNTTSANQSIQNQSNLVSEVATASNEVAVVLVNKKISKIPIRRTASNKSLISSSNPTTITKNNLTGVIGKRNPSEEVTKEEVKPLASLENQNNLVIENESEDEELFSIASSKSATDAPSRIDQTQSPTTTSEMFLLIQAEGYENVSTIAPSTSNSTLHSTMSFKPSSEFIPSGDPSKQNLTELVEDTQRLIKQMRDEISIDDFESSTDEGDYSDEFSDDYDNDGEEEEEEEEDWETEEEDDEEYDDITEDYVEETEATEALSIEDDSVSQPQSPLLIEESQDQVIAQNSHALTLTNETYDHSPAFSNEHFEQDIPLNISKNDTRNQNTLVDEAAVVAENDNDMPELSVEIPLANNLENSQSSFQYVETENNISELPVETILLHTEMEGIETATQINDDTKNKMPLHEAPKDNVLVSTSASNEMFLENSLPELPVEAVLIEDPAQHSKPNSQEHVIENNPNNDTTSATNLQTEQDPNIVLSLNHNFSQSSNNDSKPKNNEANEATTNSKEEPISIKNAQTATEETTIFKNPTELNENKELPSTSKASLQNPHESKANINKASNKTKDATTSSTKTLKPAPTKAKTNDTTKAATKKVTTASRIPKPKEVPKEQKQQETPAPKSSQNALKKNLYTRSKSFSGPTTPIGIASVKSISQKFISRTSNTQAKTTKTPTTVARKSSITEAINKFTKPSTTTTLFKSRTQPRIPKKKYHETCFSDDDYESSAEEEELEPLEVRQRKLSVPVFKAYPSVQEPEEIKTEELIQKFMKEELAKTVAEAQIAATLVSMKFPQDVSLWAAKECSDLDHAIALLKHECELCSGTYALNQIVSMLKCTHKCCKQCAKTYFTVQITERSINDCSCPFCKLPELHNQSEHEDENLEYFSNLDIFLKNILEPEVHELFQRKLRDRTLLKDPNFKWCVQCSSGFFARPKQKRLICPDCGSITCAQCRKTWQKQHEGISCEQFSKWELANDPEAQAKGVQQHLEKNGIECPKCKFKYSLTRGGCMHFTCTQCKYEFCYGCAKPFMMGAKCTISSYCAKLGLHAHHPRNCLFYLRDKLPVQLQILLKNNNVPYEVDPLEAPDIVDDNEPSSSKKKELFCPIPIQKETPTGLVDTRCYSDVPEKHAGMCRNHYVEYLAAKVAKAKIDPLPIFDLTDCVQELRRRGFALPERGPWDTDEIYKNMCSEVIKNNIPLDIN